MKIRLELVGMVTSRKLRQAAQGLAIPRTEGPGTIN
jgi:hypothetical protein